LSPPKCHQTFVRLTPYYCRLKSSLAFYKNLKLSATSQAALSSPQPVLLFAGHKLSCHGQRIVQLIQLHTATLGHVGASTAPSTHYRGGLFHKITGFK